MMCRRVVHGWRELKRRQNRNWFSNPKRVEGRKHVREGNVVVQLDALVALATPQEASVIEHVFSEGIQRPEIALSRISGLARYLDEAVVQAVDGKKLLKSTRKVMKLALNYA